MLSVRLLELGALGTHALGLARQASQLAPLPRHEPPPALHASRTGAQLLVQAGQRLQVSAVRPGPYEVRGSLKRR